MPQQYLLGAKTSGLVALLAISTSAFGGHPMLSEDTGTQGTGNAELELGFARSRLQGEHSFLFQPQLAYGVAPTVDLMVQPSWLTGRDDAGARVQGFGDTNLDFKWRFFGVAPWSLGVRAGVLLPTAENDLGLPQRKMSPHATLVLTTDVAPCTFDVNLGYARLPNGVAPRSDLYHLSAAALVAANERWFFLVDAAVDSNPTSSQARYPAVAIVGSIYTVRPGLDLDVGYRARLSADSSAAQWLVGITYRGVL